MHLPDRLDRILTAALDDCGPSRDDCAYLLGLPSESLESATLMAVADTVSRRRFKNEAMLLGQIGLETVPCPGNCKFCAFGKSHTAFERTELPMEEILLRAHSFADGEDLYALFLMTMHELEFERILSIVETVRDEIPSHTQIVVNVGDFGLAQAREMRSAGVNGAYHVCRLREGVDTDLDPQERKKTFSVIREAGLHFYYCCEPIGPEHAAQELADQIFLGIEHDCFQHAAMRRVSIPGTPLEARGQITERRLAQVVAVVALATLNCPETSNIAVHEPNLLGLVAGGNVVYAETGANPRDTEAETSRNRGLNMAACREMLYEAGFTAVRRGDGESLDLSPSSPDQRDPA